MPRALVCQQRLRSYVLLSQDAAVCEIVSTVDYQKTRESLYVSNLASTCYIQVVTRFRAFGVQRDCNFTRIKKFSLIILGHN
jgi:hypothetical protein